MLKTNIVRTIQTIAERQALSALPHGQLVDLVLMMQTQIADLQAQVVALQKNSTNSSKPPSSDLPGSGRAVTDRTHLNSRRRSGRKSGGQPGHPGSTRERSANPDEIVRCAPDGCGTCGETFSDQSDQSEQLVATAQIADIPPIVPVITEYRQYSRTCSQGHTTIGSLPLGVTAGGGMQIGPTASSFLVYLNSAHHVPYKRLQEIAGDIFHCSVSQNTIAGKLEVAVTAALPLRQTILSFLQASPWVGSDETGVRVAGKRIWQWVWQNVSASLYVISHHRDYQTVKDNFGGQFTGCLIHDCYSAQNNTTAGFHQLCHAHLLRDLEFIIQTEDSSWAYRLQQFLVRAQRARDHIWAAGFDPVLRRYVQQRYWQELEQYIQQDLTGPGATRLQKRFRKHQDKILHFMSSPDIPPDNNGSERAIRNAKVKQKVSGGYRSMRGAERQATLLSVIETAKKQEKNVLGVLQKLVSGQEVRLFGS